MGTNKLLACPFCGGAADYSKFIGDNFCIECGGCGATSNMGTMEEVAVLWNRRVETVHKTKMNKSPDCVHNLINERKPGRKSLITNDLYKRIKWYKGSITIRELAAILGISTGLVHKIMHMKSQPEAMPGQLTIEETVSV